MTRPSTRRPGVSVVIPVRDEADALRGAMCSVAEQRYDGPVEMIVADGSSDCAAVTAAARGFRDVRVLRNRRQSAAAGLALAVEAAKHPVVARCDARCTLPPGYLRRAVETLNRTGAANVGGRQVPVGATAFERVAGMAMTSLLGSGGARYRRGGPEGSIDTVFLGVFRRDAVLACGNFDATLERNQDYELNWRLRRAGGTVWFDPELAVAYRPRGSLRALARQYFDYGRGKRVVVQRAPASLRLRQILPVVLAAGLVASVCAALAGAAYGAWTATAAALSVPLAYAASLVAEAAYTLVRRRDPMAVLLPAALATMHLCWAAGFLFAGAAKRRRRDRARRSAAP